MLTNFIRYHPFSVANILCQRIDMVLSTMLIIILARISLISHGKKKNPTGKCHIPKTGTCIEGSNRAKAIKKKTGRPNIYGAVKSECYKYQ